MKSKLFLCSPSCEFLLSGLEIRMSLDDGFIISIPAHKFNSLMFSQHGIFIEVPSTMYIINQTQKENRGYNVKERNQNSPETKQNSFFWHQNPSSMSIIWESLLLFLSKFSYCIWKTKQTHKAIQPLGKLSFSLDLLFYSLSHF